MAISVKHWTALMAVVAMTQASAQAPSLEALERAFWHCDHAATHGWLDGGTAMECGVVFETFKARRFGGDFRAMLDWWGSHKDAEHLALSAAMERRRTRSTPRP